MSLPAFRPLPLSKRPELNAEAANVDVRRWLDEVANARAHATTKAFRRGAGPKDPP